MPNGDGGSLPGEGGRPGSPKAELLAGALEEVEGLKPGGNQGGIFQRGLRRLRPGHGSKGAGDAVGNVAGGGQAPGEPERDVGGSRVATDEEFKGYVGAARSQVKSFYEDLDKMWEPLHPPGADQPLALVSLLEFGKERNPGVDPESRVKAEEYVNKTHTALANTLFNGRYNPDEIKDRLQPFTPEDKNAIRELFLGKIKAAVSSKAPIIITNPENGEEVTFNTDPDWLKTWQQELHSPGFLRRGLGKVGGAIGNAGGVIAGGIGGAVGGAAGRAGETAGNLGQAIGSGELKQAVGIGLRNWVDNLNPRNIVDKDWLWKLGFGLGVAESIGFTALPLPVKGYLKAGLNLAITQGTHVALNLPRAREEARIKRQHEGYQETINQEMARIAEKYGRAHQRIKKFALGLSAGAMYGSVGSIVSEVAKEALGLDMQKIFTPRGEPAAGGAGTGEGGQAPAAVRLPGHPPMPEHPPTAVVAQPEGSLTPTPTPSSTPVAPSGAEGGTPALAGPEAPSPAPVAKPPVVSPVQPTAPASPLAEVAPAVVPHVPETITLPKGSNPWTEVKGYLEQSLGREPSEPEIQEAVSRVLAENNIADTHNILPGNLKIHGVNEHIQQLKGGQPLSEVAQNALIEQAQVAEALAQNVSTVLEAAPDLFTDQAIAHGTNVGQMLQDAGYQVTWTGADAPMLGAHIAANNDMLTEMWHQMAASHNIPESPTELNDLVAAAQAGDKEALRRLLLALRYIPTGQKFKILNKEGISAILGALG